MRDALDLVITRLRITLGNRGAVANARSELERARREAHIVDALELRVPPVRVPVATGHEAGRRIA